MNQKASKVAPYPGTPSVADGTGAAWFYGDVAVVTGLADMTGRINGETVALTIRFLEVSRRIDDTWKLTAWQSVRASAE